MNKPFSKAVILLLSVFAVTLTAGCADHKAPDASFDVQESSTVSEALKSGDDPLILGQWSSQTLADAIYTFKDDGTGTYLINGETMPLTFSTEKGKITVRFLSEGFADANPMVLNYTIENNVLNIIDSHGTDTLYDKVD